jgi:FkbM family methyltransferase
VAAPQTERTMLKCVRLAIAVSLAAIGSVLYFHWTEPQRLYTTYRCLRGAESWTACYSGSPFSFRTETLGIIYEGNTRDGIDRAVLNYGAHEKPEVFFLRDVSTGGIFLDVGANKGLYSLVMSRYQKQVHAFEPYETVLKKFREMVAKNGIRNIVIHPIGLGEKRERLIFQEPDEENMGLGSFAFVSKNRAHRELEVMTGDEALSKAGVTEVELIKMDIEGFERPALRGLAQTLARGRPIVVFELTIDPARPTLFKSVEDISKVFPVGYEFLVFKDWDLFTGGYELGPLSGHVRFDHASTQPYNVIAFPIEKKDRVPLKGPVRQ